MRDGFAAEAAPTVENQINVNNLSGKFAGLYMSE